MTSNTPAMDSAPGSDGLPSRAPGAPVTAAARESSGRAATAPGSRLALGAALALVSGGYFAAGKFGLMLAGIHPSATAIWPCTGIAIAALLVMGPRVWPAIFVSAFLVNVTTAGSPLSSLGIATGNTLEAWVGALLIQRFAGGRDPFSRAQDTFRYAGLVGVACVVSATFGVTSLALTGFAPWEQGPAIWLTWWLGDLGGALIVSPFLLIWSRDRGFRWQWVRVREAVAMLACLAFLGWTVFRWVSPLSLGISLMFLCVPPLIWAAFRFGQRMGATALLTLATTAVWGTLGRFGHSQAWELNQSLLVVQVFLGVMAVTTLALSAVVAERRRVTEAVQATSDQLREAVTQLEAFSYAISHDLRSPIGTVVNCVAILEEDHTSRIGEDGVRLLERIQSAADSATRLLDQLALFAWAGPSQGEQEIVDMTALASEAFVEVSNGHNEVEGVRFELSKLPPAVGSSVLLVRVFRNLLSNAVKYTRDREHRVIQVTGVAGAAENTYFVSDNGIGFDPDDREAVFEPFRRLSGAKGFEGSGLGLAIVAKIVRRHGGRIWAESDGSTGARFGFTLRNDGARS